MPICPHCNRYFSLPHKKPRGPTERQLREQEQRRLNRERLLEQTNRRHEMVCLHQQDKPMTYVAIAKQFGLSPPRVRNIVLTEEYRIKQRLPKVAKLHDLSGLLERI